MSAPFRYIYEMSLPTVIGCLLILVLTWGILRTLLLIRRQSLCRFFSWVLFCMWAVIAVYHTVFSRETRDPTYSIIPFSSYYMALFEGWVEKPRESFMNWLFFIPGGLWLPELFSNKMQLKRKILLSVIILFAMSLVIELTQFFFALGLAETDDVIHNTLGAVTGSMFFFLFQWVKKRRSGME